MVTSPPLPSPPPGRRSGQRLPAPAVATRVFGAEPGTTDVVVVGGPGGATVTPTASLVVGRALGTVVVTVSGALDGEASGVLERLLIDLIDGQGNSTVAVDLGKATCGPAALCVFLDAGRRADLHGTTFILQAPAPEVHRALRSGGLAPRVEVIPRR